MDTQYFRKWSAHEKSGLHSISADEAQTQHEVGEPYVAVMFQGGLQRYAIRVTPLWVGVYFFDALRRNYMYYDFQKLDGERLFLKSAIHREYVGETQELAASTLFNFATNGEILMSRTHNGSTTDELRVAEADPSQNWEDYPKFGDYSGLCVEGRQG